MLTPLLDVLPLIGCVQVFTTSMPAISWEFVGVAGVPGLEEAIVGIVDAAVRRVLVLPNRLCVPVCKDPDQYDIVEAGTIPPVGVLKIQAKKARNLSGANWKWGNADR